MTTAASQGPHTKSSCARRRRTPTARHRATGLRANQDGQGFCPVRPARNSFNAVTAQTSTHCFGDGSLFRRRAGNSAIVRNLEFQGGTTWRKFTTSSDGKTRQSSTPGREMVGGSGSQGVHRRKYIEQSRRAAPHLTAAGWLARNLIEPEKLVLAQTIFKSPLNSRAAKRTRWTSRRNTRS